MWRAGFPAVALVAAACGRIGFAQHEDGDAAIVPGDMATPEAGAPCSSGTAGPSQVEVTIGANSFCIDATEVTRGQYQPFLAATPANTVARCAFDVDYTPAVNWPPAGGEMTQPVVGVDWCDAAMFCRWAGKRLCGAIGGGTLALAQGATTSGEWFATCSSNGTRAFPYGTTHVGGRCSDGAVVVAVGSFAQCETVTPGVLDMSGNAHEWIDACAVVGGAGDNDTCMLLGGGIGGHSATDMRCDAPVMYARSSPGNDSALSWRRETGFPCCGS